MLTIFCWIRGAWRSLEHMVLFSGHTFQDDEVHENVTVTIGHCETCGWKDISWSKQ